MPNQHNQDQVQIIKDKLSKAKSVAIFDYSGTSVSDMTQLRSKVGESGGEVFVTKNTLINVAVGTGKLSDSLTGMNAIIFSYQDAVSAIKQLFSFQKETDKLTIKQGLMVEEDDA